MKTDRYTKVILTLIAVGLFLNLATNLPVQPAFAQLQFPSSITVQLVTPGFIDVKHYGNIGVH